MSGPELDIVGLFPSLDDAVFGGVQASGREAWQAIVATTGERRADALYYEAGRSKAKAVIRAISRRRKVNVVLVWHLDLLKLLPFVDRSASRVILFLHGIEAWRKHDRLTHLLLKKKVDLILSNSDHTWHRFLECNPAFRNTAHRTVHLGAGLRSGETISRSQDSPVALMVGRLSAGENYKGHRQLIEAWPLVLARMPEAQLWIVGDGDLRTTLEDLARKHLPARAVRFYGQVPDVAKEQLLAQCRCMALPSRGEGFGLVYVEAMRMGRPCLVSNRDAGREVVNPPEAGLAVDPGDAGGVADAVCRLLIAGAEWDAWSQRARSRYEAHFTREHFHHRLVTALFET
jgi:phosphatidylinositol alpha-1,6-mannosyltransferase